MNTLQSLQVKIPLKTKFGTEFIEISEIIYFFIEGGKVNALLIDGQSIRVFHTLAILESSLSELNFHRCHSAILINLVHIRRYNHKTCTVELTNNISVKVACYRKVEFNRMINSTLSPPSPLINLSVTLLN